MTDAAVTQAKHRTTMRQTMMLQTGTHQPMRQPVPHAMLHVMPETTEAGGETVRLSISGFRSFSEVNTARKALARLPGVASVAVRPGTSGSMLMSIAYTGIVPFQMHLDESLRRRDLAIPSHLQIIAA